MCSLSFTEINCALWIVPSIVLESHWIWYSFLWTFRKRVLCPAMVQHVRKRGRDTQCLPAKWRREASSDFLSDGWPGSSVEVRTGGTFTPSSALQGERQTDYTQKHILYTLSIKWKLKVSSFACSTCSFELLYMLTLCQYFIQFYNTTKLSYDFTWNIVDITILSQHSKYIYYYSIRISMHDNVLGVV